MPVPELPKWEDELTPDQLEKFTDLQQDPVSLVNAMREDIEFQVALARADTRPHLIHWFTELDISRTDEGWVADLERSGPIGPLAVGTEWSWSGVHDDVGGAPINDTAPSGRTVTVRGFTLMGVDKGELAVRRYCDWVGLFAQLHLTLNWRMPIGEPPEE